MYKERQKEIDSSSIFGLYLTNLWLNSILLVLCERKEKALVQEFLQVTKGSITYRQCEANLYLIRFYFKFKHVFYSSARVAATMFDSILVIGLHQQSSMVSNKIIRFIHHITSPTTKHYSILLFHAISTICDCSHHNHLYPLHHHRFHFLVIFVFMMFSCS